MTFAVMFFLIGLAAIWAVVHVCEAMDRHDALEETRRQKEAFRRCVNRAKRCQ